MAGHSIPSTFFCTSAVCLVNGPNVNKKSIGFFRWAFLGLKLLKNQFLRIKLLPKLIF